MSRAVLENLLLIGKVLRPHGVRGLLKIKSYADSDSTFLRAGEIYLCAPKGGVEKWELLSIKPHKGHFLMELKGFHTREKAEEYRDADIYIDKSALVKEEGEFFWYELVGLRVYLVTGEYLGKIVEIMPTGSNDVYVVQEGKREYLIPAIEDVVKEVDIENNKMIIDPLEGLLEIAEPGGKKRKGK